MLGLKAWATTTGSIFTFELHGLSSPLGLVAYVHLWAAWPIFTFEVHRPIFTFFFFFGLFETGSPCSPRCPGTLSVEEAGLELTKIYLPLPPKC